MSLELPEAAMRQRLHGLSGSGTFESHITVRAHNFDRELFQKFCAEHRVKAVLIELTNGTSPTQPMTSCYHRGELVAVVEELATLVQSVRSAGFAVQRVKLEAVASNLGVPVTDDEAKQFPDDTYFELHLKLILNSDSNLINLEGLVEKFGARLSRNAFKQTTDGRSERFVTLRVYQSGRTTAEQRLDELEQALTHSGYEISQRQREFALFDSDSDLDAGWLDDPGQNDD